MLRRSTRTTTSTTSTNLKPGPSAPKSPRKRKFRELDLDEQLSYLLKSPTSPLTLMNLSKIINFETWNRLSPDSRATLSTLLPPTAFLGFQASVEPHHPSHKFGNDHVGPTAPESEAIEGSSGSLVHSFDHINPTFFTDPHFLAATHTFQDHLCTGWMTDDHLGDVDSVNRGIRDGSLHAPWKDDEWERDNATAAAPATTTTTPLRVSRDIVSQHESSARAGEAAELKLVDLVKNSILKVGDVIAYKRNFTNFNLVIEKDVMIQSIHPKTHALTVLLESGITQYLPLSLVSRQSPEPTPTTQEMIVSTPSMLETGLLDIDGRVERSRRPNGNAWKALTVWRWPEPPAADPAFEDVRGGRENHGTLFYLRGCFYHDR